MTDYVLIFVIEFIFFSLLFLVVSLPVTKKFLRHKINYRFSLGLILALQIISIALLKKEVGDVMLFSGAGWHLRHKIDFYFIDSDHSQYPFLPFLIFLYAPLNFIVENLLPQFTFSFFLKIFLLVGLYYLALSITSNRQRQLQFLTSPLTYAPVLFHGQTDVLLLAFLILSLRLKRPLGKGLVYAASIAVKTWSGLLLPVVLQSMRSLKPKLVFCLAVAGFIFIDIFVYTRYVFGSSFRTVLPAVFKAGGPIGQWGLTYPLSFIPGFHLWFPQYTFIFFFSFWLVGQLILWQKPLPFKKLLLANILLLYLILSRWGIQYLFWLWPILFFTKFFTRLPGVKPYLWLTTVYLGLNYFNVAVGRAVVSGKIIYPLGFMLWFLFAYWFIWLLRPVLPSRLPVRR